jgi:hypothetical protein
MENHAAAPIAVDGLRFERAMSVELEAMVRNAVWWLMQPKSESCAQVRRTATPHLNK